VPASALLPSDLVIRAITPHDGVRLSAGLARMSADSVRSRFLAPKARLSGAELRYLTEVDGVNHVALVAVRPGGLLAVGRFIRSVDSPDEAEVAIVVADDLHGLGLGTRLGLALADAARERGIRRFTATMLAENVAAHRLFASISTRLVEHHNGPIDELVAELGRAA